MRREWLLSFCAVVFAFLGSQHHNLMMLLFAVGLGSMSAVMMEAPLLRDVMMTMSLVMAAVIGYRISRPERPAAMRVTGALSILFTLGLAGWSVLHFGL